MDERCVCGNEVYSRGMCSVCYQKDYRNKHGASRPTIRNKEGNICSSTGKDIFPPEGHPANSSSDSAELTLWSDRRPERETAERDTVA